jgi:hypothetical protein
MNVLDDSAAREPRHQHLIDLALAHSTGENTLHRGRCAFTWVGWIEEQRDFAFDGAPPWMEWLEQNAALTLTCDEFRHPRGPATATS